MNTELEMTALTALIRPNTEARVMPALHDLLESRGFFVSEVRGQGRGRGADGSYAARESDLTYHHLLQTRLVCRADAATDIGRTTTEAAWTGREGDGAILTAKTHAFFHTCEQGNSAAEFQK